MLHYIHVNTVILHKVYSLSSVDKEASFCWQSPFISPTQFHEPMCFLRRILEIQTQENGYGVRVVETIPPGVCNHVYLVLPSFPVKLGHRLSLWKMEPIASAFPTKLLYREITKDFEWL